jgi:hypothetical protein
LFEEREVERGRKRETFQHVHMREAAMGIEKQAVALSSAVTAAAEAEANVYKPREHAAAETVDKSYVTWMVAHSIAKRHGCPLGNDCWLLLLLLMMSSQRKEGNLLTKGDRCHTLLSC